MGVCRFERLRRKADREGHKDAKTRRRQGEMILTGFFRLPERDGKQAQKLSHKEAQKPQNKMTFPVLFLCLLCLLVANSFPSRPSCLRGDSGPCPKNPPTTAPPATRNCHPDSASRSSASARCCCTPPPAGVPRTPSPPTAPAD